MRPVARRIDRLMPQGMGFAPYSAATARIVFGPYSFVIQLRKREP